MSSIINGIKKTRQKIFYVNVLINSVYCVTLAYIPVDVTMIHLIHLEQLCIHMCFKLSKYTLHVNRVNIMSVLKVLFFGLKVLYNLLIIFDYVNLV